MIPLDKLSHILHEKTAIPIGIGVIIGYILVWAVHTGDDVIAHAQRIAQVEVKQEVYNRDMQEIRTHLVLIEHVLRIKPRENK